ncbi:Eukaryotic translation initiation factor 2c [Paragonimus heterotremus]|uniref:Eukaryotic translation initiation factor 2c n=1 Tax=Paragonimus heterotremus TaxID=100268 RepID=A0A8J4SNU3_9TREM|nr:Eukaryotic translation initiation factor 2c [Paragonimus heterotremus]
MSDRGDREQNHGRGDRKTFLTGPPPSARGHGGARYSQPKGPDDGRNQRGPPRGGYGSMQPPQRPPPGRARGWGAPSSGGGGRQQTSSREESCERAPSADSLTRKPYGSESDSGSSRKPSEFGDTVSPARSTDGLNDVARQKKSHPIMRPGSDLAGALAKLNIQRAVRVPSRPDNGGKSGQPIDVITNCWDLSVLSKSVLMYFVETVAVYRVDKEKGDKVEIRMPPKEKRALIQQIVNTLPPETIYDGGHAVYSEKPIPGVSKDPITKNLEIKDPLNRDQLLLEYRIMEVQTVSTDDVSNFIKNTKATSLDMPQDSIRLLDCILKTICKGSFESIGRNALFIADPVKVVHDKLFSIHKGFITSVRPQWKVRVNIDMTCKAFFTCGNLADVLYEKYGDNIASCSRQMTMDLKRIRVETEPFYKNDSGGTYSRRFTVHGFSSEPAAKLLIPDVKMSVAEYFQQHHNIKLKYPELPCVKVNLSRDVFMPMELLNILPYQSPNAKKSDIASEVIRCAAVRAHDRFNELQTFVNKMLQSTHPLVKLFGVKVEPRAVKTPARVLDTPTACFGHQTCPLGRGKWTPPAFFRPAGVDGAVRWAILSIPGDRNAARHQQMLMAQFDTNARRFRIVLDRPECAVIQRAEIVQRFQQFQSRGINFVLLVLYDDLNYPAIKRLGDLQTGMRTQCVRGRTLDKPNVVPNLLLKINGKLGGINWQINDILRDDKELMMVFGADVTHPAPTQTQQVRQSIAAVLGSVTPDLMRYGVVVRQQATTERGSKTTREIIDAMEVIVSELLKAYYRNTDGRFPTRLIFYRDGVSEGQFENVLVEELASIQRACSSLRQGYEPAITYIVVQKRHHVRFQPTNPRQRNVDPGTVVDTHVTHPREFDFYLCSQEGIQGTSKPAHYHVLYDDSNWTSDALQRFTFFLCHAYMRCPRSVSYPAPTYYAHLAAFRARDWVSDLDKPATLLQDGRFRVHESQMTGMYYL